MNIGEKLQRLRLECGLTQQELADRAELSKGFISQVERGLASPSIVTFIDLLECLGTTPADFFMEVDDEKIVFLPDDMFEKQEDGKSIVWLIPNAQKNMLEPIVLTLSPGSSTQEDAPHAGEEFGYMLSGTASLVLGGKRHRVKKGSSFCFKPNAPHYIENTGRVEVRLLWVSTPPSF